MSATNGSLLQPLNWASNPYLIAFCAAFVGTLAKSVQQLNVAHAMFWLIPPVSLFMAACEVLAIFQTVHTGYLVFVPMGIGASLGSILGILIHRKIRKPDAT